MFIHQKVCIYTYWIIYFVSGYYVALYHIILATHLILYFHETNYSKINFPDDKVKNLIESFLHHFGRNMHFIYK